MRLLAAARLAPVLAAVLAAGCIPRRPPPDLSADPGELLAQVRRAQAQVVRVQGDVRIRLHAPRKAAFRGFAAAERPDRLHLEALDFFGNPAGVLVASGGRFAFFDARANTVYTGEATPENLSRLVPVPVSAEELVAILLGSAPLPDVRPAEATADDGHLRLRLEEDGATVTAWIGAHALVDKAVRAAGGGSAPGSWRVEFSDHRAHGDAWFPEYFALRSDAAKVRLELTWAQVEVNGAIDPALFELRMPKGARVVEVGAAPE
jgi:outer membrane biogenesis lipoprotein LolB